MKNLKPIRNVMAFLLIVALLATALLLGAFGDQALAAKPRTWQVDDDGQDYPNADFTRIQDAVDAASTGDSILVYPGTYTENVDVNKSLTIKSESRAGSTIVEAASSDERVFDVTADYVNISGFAL
ncbi:MAG: hypothetical protein DDT26_00456 [Dehalococcoidia bacterium]|nr:hypothetical protein [Chloroflexota bacterium]